MHGEEDLARHHGSEAITQSPAGVDGLSQGLRWQVYNNGILGNLL